MEQKRRKVSDKIIELTQTEGPITLTKEIINQLQVGDEIEAGFEEPFYSENNSHDGYFFLSVFRNRLENDQEYEKRVQEEVKAQVNLRARRYQTYLKLKAEFDN